MPFVLCLLHHIALTIHQINIILIKLHPHVLCRKEAIRHNCSTIEESIAGWMLSQKYH